MSFVVSPFVALGVWAVVALTGSIVSSFILLVLSWSDAKQKSNNALSASTAQTNAEAEEEEIESEEDEELTPAGEEMEMQTESEEEIPVEVSRPIMMQPETGFLLPPRMEGDPRRLTVVLDLDETLVRSCEAEDVPMQLEFAASMGLLQR